MKLEIGRGGDRASDVMSVLNLALADECLLYSRVRNIYATLPARGPGGLRKLLADQFDELAGLIDCLMERVRELGGPGLKTMSKFLQYTEAREPRIKSGLPLSVIRRQLISQHEALARTLNGDLQACLEEYDDAASADLVGNLISWHERMRTALREIPVD